MKKMLCLFTVACAMTTMACKDIGTNKSDSPADTATLVKDPDNTLNAKPVNDTEVHVTTADTAAK